MSPVIALREKLATAGLLLVLVVTLMVTRQQQAKDAHRSWGELPRPPEERELQRAFPVPPLALEQLQATEDFTAYAPLLEQDPFARIQTATPSTDAPEPVAAPMESQLHFRGRVVMGQRQVAVIEVESSHETLFVGVGQEVDGLKVIDIAEDRVVLSKPPDTQVTLQRAEATTSGGARGGRGPQ